MTWKTLVALVVVMGTAVGVGIGAANAGIEKLYVLDCGQNIGKDQSRWSPGVNEGKAIEFSDNCYLIRHDRGVLLWDTGIPDAVAAMPDGMVVASGAITYRRVKTLAAQLEQIGVKPSDVTHVAVSHTHGDHVGNLALFPSSTVLIQGAEYDWAMAGPAKPTFVATQAIKKLAGDHERVRRREREDRLHPGPHAGPSIAPGAAAEDRRAPAIGRRGAPPGQLGAPARAVDEFQSRADAGLDEANRRAPGGTQGAALDQPR